MDRTDRLRRLFRYEAWANRETLESLSGASPGKATRVLAHVLGAGKLWLERLRGTKPTLAVWPDLPPERCRSGFEELDASWRDYLDRLAPGDYERSIEYVNTKGERWSSTVEDVLSHVLLHSAYHRGQIAAEVRASGGEPPLTDFIHAVRQGRIDPER